MGGTGAKSGGGGATAAAGLTTGAGTRVDVTLKITQLQNLCKRDPVGYREDYDAQIRRLESEIGILQLQPTTEPSSNLIELIQFAAAVSSSSYKGPESERIVNMLVGLLVGGGQSATATTTTTTATLLPTAAVQLHREVRKTLISALILMRNKGACDPLRILELFFRIMAVVADKKLREMLYHHVLNDIRNINKKGKRDEKVNRAIQSFLHRVVNAHHHGGGGGGNKSVSAGKRGGGAAAEETATDVAAKRATDLVAELYRRRVWTDARTVAIMASAVESRNVTVMCRAMRFFLGIEEKMARDAQESQANEWASSNNVDFHLHSKKTHARKRHVMRQIKNRKKAQLKKETGDEYVEVTPDQDQGVEASKKLYPAMELLRDPQGLAEVSLKRLKTAGNTSYEHKLLMMNFVTRLVGNHELQLLPLYPFLQKYLQGHQRDVTAVLAYTVQACHEQVPPEEVYGILKTIAHNFITERCSEEQMAVGINAARAICARVPSVLSIEESQDELTTTGSASMDIEAFARDLAAYGKHRDRSVAIAAKAWTNYVREVHPSLLQGKTRGLQGSALHRAGTKPLRYGERKAAAGVEGADLLVEYEAKKEAHRLSKAASGGTDGSAAGGEDEEAEEGEWKTAANDDEDDSDSEAPELVRLGNGDGGGNETTSSPAASSSIPEVAKMTQEQRDALKQKVSSTRVFSAADFAKMRKLVDREQRAKRDPREAARRKRAIARGETEFDELSDDDSTSDDDSDEEVEVRITGAVNPTDLMAESKKKRQSKADRIEKILAGRSAFEARQRAGGTTDMEKKRNKNFVMSKFSREARTKGKGKPELRQGRKRGSGQKPLTHEAKKRRRKT